MPVRQAPAYLVRVANGRDAQIDRVGEALVRLVTALGSAPRDRDAEARVEAARGRAEVLPLRLRHAAPQRQSRLRLHHGRDAGRPEFLLERGLVAVPADQTDGPLAAPVEPRLAG